MPDAPVSGPRFEAELPSEADVVVVGGGIAGTSTAYHLAVAGVRTLLLERDRIGSGATASAVGLLSPPMRQPFDQTVQFRGQETAREIWELAARSVSGLAALLTERGKADACALDLSGGYVLAEAHTLHEVQAAHRALDEAGIAAEWLSAEEVRTLTGGPAIPGGFRLEGGGSVNPRAAAIALAEAAEEAGATIVEEAEVRSTRREKGSIYCETPRGEVRSEMVVYATHVDSRRFSAFLGDEIVPIRGQGMVAEAGAPVFRGAFSTHWMRNVWRSDARGRLMLGGWRHDAWDRGYWKMKPEIDERLQGDLEAWFNTAFPGTDPLRVERRWSGIFGWSADYLPLVGPLPGRIDELVITGFSGSGLPFAFESGRTLRAIVTGAEPVAGSELLSPRRFSTVGA